MKQTLYHKRMRKHALYLIRMAWVDCKYNQSRAARKLGISRNHLRKVLKEAGDLT